MREVYYVINLDDDGYVMINQDDNLYVDVYSAKKLLNAEFWDEEDIEAAYNDLILGKNENFEFIYRTDARPIAISRVTMEIEDIPMKTCFHGEKRWKNMTDKERGFEYYIGLCNDKIKNSPDEKERTIYKGWLNKLEKDYAIYKGK